MNFIDLLKEVEIKDSVLSNYLKSEKFKISQDITTKRTKLGLSQDDVAKMLGITKTEFIEIESASRKVNESVCYKVLEFLNNL